MEALTTLMIQRKDIDFTVYLENGSNDSIEEHRIFNLLFGLCIDSISKIGSLGSYSVIKGGNYAGGGYSAQMLSRLVSCLKCIQNLLKQISNNPQIMSKVYHCNRNIKRRFL